MFSGKNNNNKTGSGTREKQHGMFLSKVIKEKRYKNTPKTALIEWDFVKATGCHAPWASGLDYGIAARVTSGQQCLSYENTAIKCISRCFLFKRYCLW